MDDDIDKMQVDLDVLLGKKLEGGRKGRTEGYERIGFGKGIVLNDFIHNRCIERRRHKRQRCKLGITNDCQYYSSNSFYNIDCVFHRKWTLFDRLNPLDHLPL